MDGFTFHRPHPKPTSARDTRQYIDAEIVVVLLAFILYVL